MTVPELRKWADAPAQAENVVADAVKLLFRLNETLEIAVVKLKGDLSNMKRDGASQERENARLRKASLPRGPWEAEEEVPL